MNNEFEEMAAKLAQHPDYRVLRRLAPVVQYGTTEHAENIRRGIVLDVETTGLSFATDKIIELGAVLFSYDSTTGQVLDVLAAKSWFEDPGRPIPAEVAKLTGITDAEVQGQRIDDDQLRELLADVGLIIAHNASFDRPFVDRRFPFLSDRHWGCSMNDVPWRTAGIGSSRLDYLLHEHAGMFLDTHHRALEDCRATLHVLASAFSDGRIPLGLLLSSCRTPRSRVAAVRSPFDTKDKLRQRGYAWSGDHGQPPKTWCKEILTQDLEQELAWLREQVYASATGQPLVEKLDLRQRYRG